MVPVELAIESPGGRPMADHVKVWPVWESVAELVSGVMAVPVMADWFAGCVTDTVLVTVQVKADEVTAKAWESVTVTVGVYVPGVVGVPLMVPPAEIERPGGRPEAL